MATSKKFVRSANFSSEEKALLISIISRYIKIIECKQTDGSTKQEKNSTWEMIARDFNSQGGSSCLRTATSLKSCYDNEKKRARKAVGDEKVEIFKTGGGACRASNVTALQEQVLSMIPGTAEPLENSFDSDAGYLSLVAKSRGSSTSSPQIVEMEEDMAIVEAPIAVDYIDISAFSEFNAKTSTTSALPIQDWTKYTAKMLRTPIHNSFKTVPKDKDTTSEPPPTATNNSEKGIPLKPQWTSRRRPSIQNPPVAEVNIKFENLAEAKLELVKIQIQAAKDEQKRKKKREEDDDEMRKAVHQKVIGEYERRERTELEVHKKRMEIMEAELKKMRK